MIFKSLLALAVGAGLFWAIGTASMRIVAPEIERDLAAQVGRELREAGLPTEQVLVDGRDVYVEGELAGEATFTQVSNLLASVDGIRRVDRRGETAGLQPRMELAWSGTTVTIHGHLGATQDPALVAEGLRAVLGGATIVDSLQSGANVDRAFWIDAVPELMRIVWSEVQNGRMSIEGLSLTVSGTVDDANVRAELGELLAAAAPQVRVRNRISVPKGTPVATERVNEILAEGPIEFEERSDRLTDASESRLNRIAGVMEDFPEVSIQITVHYDNGHPTISAQRSRVKARVVRSYLMSRGVPQRALIARGRGQPEEGSNIDADSAQTGGEFVRVTLKVI